MNKKNLIPRMLTFATTILLVGIALAAVALNRISIQSVLAETNSSAANTVITNTPIKHLIVIFQENISFDHYFVHILMLKIPLVRPLFWPYLIHLQ
jgi:phospholipase C